MRTEASWRWILGVMLFGLFLALPAPERGQAASDPESGAALAPESRDEDVAAASGTRQDLPAAGLGTPSNWQVYRGRSPVSGAVTIELVTSSENPIRDKEETFRPTLDLRCEGPKLEVSVVTGLAARRMPDSENEHAVSLRFGEGSARTVLVRSRFERRVLLLEPPGEMVREMLDNQQLVFGFTSVSQWLAQRRVEMTFDLRGLRDLVPELTETCSL